MRSCSGAVGLVLVLFIALSARAAAQEAAAAAPVRALRGGSPISGRDTPTIDAAPAAGPIRVDGRLDETAWQQAVPASPFRQLDPEEGARASEPTTVRILIAADALYIGARLDDRDAGRIRAQLARRDAAVESDLFEVAIDAYHDHRTAVVFAVTPAGSRRDASIGSDGVRDDSWDGVWSAGTAIDDGGWSVEMRIPLSQLRYSSEGDSLWGIQLRRFLSRRQESAVFAFTPKREQLDVSRYGHLAGLGHLRPSRRLELLPYIVGKGRGPEPANPLRDGVEPEGSVGLDLKYGVTNSFTLDATINPDFGQVDVDPAEVNLTAYETFFPERRPFFVEGADIFRFGDLHALWSARPPRVFHSRRIGRAPQHSLAFRGDYVDVPVETRLAGAAKLSGRTASGWAVGLMDAVSRREEGRYLDGENIEREASVEPATNYLVGRVRRELHAGNTAIGGILSAVHRDLSDPELAELLRSRAFVGGVDFNHAWKERSWLLDVAVLASRVEGTEAAIARTQRSSIHYFQRPDQRPYRLDSTRTSLSGYDVELAVTKAAGDHWLGSVAYQEASPGVEVNDVGFAGRADYRSVATYAGYKQDVPGRLLRSWRGYFWTRSAWTIDGVLGFQVNTLGLKTQLANYWTVTAEATYYPPFYDDRLSFGGPLIWVPYSQLFSLALASDPRRPLTIGTSYSDYTDPSGYVDRVGTVTVALHPSSALQLRLEPTLRVSRFPAQYVTSVEDQLQTATFGRRYVFSDLDQRTLSLEARVDWVFTPTTSLQVFAQPFLNTGRYRDFKELLAPRTFDFARYGRDRGTMATDPVTRARTVDPDGAGPAPSFTFADPTLDERSLRANAVLRWEYRPGSTLFLVWQQRRTDAEVSDDFRPGRGYSALFRSHPENVIVAKATYWLGR